MTVALGATHCRSTSLHSFRILLLSFEASQLELVVINKLPGPPRRGVRNLYLNCSWPHLTDALDASRPRMTGGLLTRVASRHILRKTPLGWNALARLVFDIGRANRDCGWREFTVLPPFLGPMTQGAGVVSSPPTRVATGLSVAPLHGCSDRDV